MCPHLLALYLLCWWPPLGLTLVGQLQASTQPFTVVSERTPVARTRRYTLMGGAGSQDQPRSQTPASSDPLSNEGSGRECRVLKGNGGSGSRPCRQMLGNGVCAAWTAWASCQAQESSQCRHVRQSLPGPTQMSLASFPAFCIFISFPEGFLVPPPSLLPPRQLLSLSTSGMRPACPTLSQSSSGDLAVWVLPWWWAP